MSTTEHCNKHDNWSKSPCPTGTYIKHWHTLHDTSRFVAPVQHHNVFAQSAQQKHVARILNDELKLVVTMLPQSVRRRRQAGVMAAGQAKLAFGREQRLHDEVFVVAQLVEQQSIDARRQWFAGGAQKYTIGTVCR